MAAPLRILLFSSLYPNDEQPDHGIFVETRLRHFLALGGVEAKVVAPVPWFPWRHRCFGRWSAFARVPATEIRHGIEILHPRYPVLPKIGMTLAPRLMRAALRGPLARLRQRWDFDLIDAHYFYPDGVAAAGLAAALAKPLVITARGTDINLIPRHAGPRRQIQWAAGQADALVAVCQALKHALVALAVPADKIAVLRNGVDLQLFRPIAPQDARRQWQVGGPTILSVGQLIERKGHHLLIDALPALPGVTLLVAGDGPQGSALRQRAVRRGVGERVRWLGHVPHESLPSLYSAADLLVLASSREGWANVLLEAMACGTPVAATDVWGTAEVVAAPAAGALIRQRRADDVAAVVARLLAAPPDRAATRRYAEGFDWDATSRGQLALFQSVLARRSP